MPSREWIIGGDEWLLSSSSSSSALSRIVTRRRRRMATTFFSIPTPHNNTTTLLLSSQRHFTNINNSWLLHGSTSSRYGHSYKPTITIPLCSSPSTTTTQVAAEPDSEDTSFSGCTACGREEIQNGCNGEGRIQGGIATVPGFGWWPIKAYRPCPGFVASGGRYRRQGQSMDEVASGRGRRAKTSSELKSSKKKQGNLADDLKKV